MKKTIYAFGELLWDILPSCTVLGGAPFNFAYRVNSLGDTGLMTEAIQLAEELGLANVTDEQPDVDELLARLCEIRSDWDWQEKIDPYALSEGVPLSKTNQQGIYNRAILIAAERSFYTKGLESELGKLQEISEENYKDTSLGTWLTSQSIESPPADQPPSSPA